MLLTPNIISGITISSNLYINEIFKFTNENTILLANIYEEAKNSKLHTLNKIRLNKVNETLKNEVNIDDGKPFHIVGIKTNTRKK